MGTSLVSSTSTLVEHGGVVGKWIMQLSKQVSVSEFANTKDLLQRQNSVVIPQKTKNVSEISLLRISIQAIVCSPDPEPRESDGRQDSKRVPPSKQCELSCKTTQQLESKNQQATDWQTNRLIPRRGHILLHRVFMRLRIQIEDELLLCLFPFSSFLCLCARYNPCLCLYLAGKGETHSSESHHSLLWQAFPLRPLVHTAKSSSDHFSESLCLFFAKKGSSASFGYTFVFSFSLSFSSSHLAALEWSELPGTLSVVPCPET